MKQFLSAAAVCVLLLSGCEKDDPAPLVIEPETSTEDTSEALFKRFVVTEIFSANTCGACPLAHYELGELETSVPELLHISHYISLPLAHEYTDWLLGQSQRTLFTPLAIIQRQSDARGPIYYTSNRFEEMISGEFRRGPADLGLDIASDVVNDEMEVTVTVRRNDNFEEETVRLTVVLLENSVVGEGQGYDQRNYGHTDPDHPYYEQGEWIPRFNHTNIIRATITSDLGEEVAFDGLSGTWTTTLPADVLKDMPDNYSLIAMVQSVYTSADGQAILNARMAPVGQMVAPSFAE